MKYDCSLMGYLLKHERLRKGYSVRSVARAVNISDTELARIENGFRKSVNLITLIRLCKVLNINFIKLLKVTNYLPKDYGEEPNAFKNDDMESVNVNFESVTTCDNCKYYSKEKQKCLFGRSDINDF